MTHRSFLHACAIGAATLVTPVFAQDQAGTQTRDQTRTQAKAETKDPAKIQNSGEADEMQGPKYFDLRYDDDFSYLDGDAGSYQADFFDPIKNIKLGEDWRLSIGGELRFKLESETNKDFGLTPRSNDVFQLYRFLLHLDLKYRDAFRLFVQGIQTFDEDRDQFDRASDENQWDMHQAFFDVKLMGDTCPLTLRLGRQELTYGNIRYITTGEWNNVRQRFDAVKLFAHGDMWDVDMWYAKPVPVKRRSFDDWDEEVDFYGLYTTYKGIENHGVDFYFLALDDTGNPASSNFGVGDRDTYMFGSRFWGKTGNWDYETELSGQWGHWDNDTVQGWAWAIYGGYTLADLTCKPRFGAGFDWATGDDNPTDSAVGTFNPFFPNGHAHLGALDLVARSNVTSGNVSLSAWPIADKVKAAATYYAFCLSEERDALYTVSGVNRRDFFGNSGKEVGHELDLTVNWQVDVHSALSFGWAHFWAGNFIVASGPDDDADLLYMQYQFKF